MPDPPFDLLRPRRAIDGCSAVLLPLLSDGGVDWSSFRGLLERTLASGLTPAVNMDTGYVNLLDPATVTRVLDTTAEVLAGRAFLAGAFVGDHAGDRLVLDAHARAAVAVQAAGGTPVLFPSHGLAAAGDDELIEFHERLADDLDRFVAFELGPMFVPFGRIWTLDTFAEVMQIPACVGVKHSSLSRTAEWDRLRSRDARRPDFTVYTGNDLAIDMVMYGSDYLLGLSAFAPDVFAERDRLWSAGDVRFFEVNDALQYLGAFAFRAPVPAYKHSAAQFLARRGWITSDATPPGAPRRADHDGEVLVDIAHRLGVTLRS